MIALSGLHEHGRYRLTADSPKLSYSPVYGADACRMI